MTNLRGGGGVSSQKVGEKPQVSVGISRGREALGGRGHPKQEIAAGLGKA